MRNSVFISIIGLMCMLVFAGCSSFTGTLPSPGARIEIQTTIFDEKGEVVNTGAVGAIVVSQLENVTNIGGESDDISDTTVSSSLYQDSGEESAGTSPIYIDTTATSTDSYATGEITTQNITVCFARSVQFTFYPVNGAGADITNCTISYYNEEGIQILDLQRKLKTFLFINPERTEGVPYTLEIFTPIVQNFFQSRGYTSGQAVVTFEGVDFLGNPVVLEKEVNISYFLPDVSVENPLLGFSPSKFCSLVKRG